MLEARKDLRGVIQWRNADSVTIEHVELLHKCGVATIVNDGEYCSVVKDSN